MCDTKSCEEERTALVRSKYHLRARTGHQTLSSVIEDNEEMAGRKISTAGELSVWFLAKKPALGMRRTPDFSHLMWPVSVERALIVLRRLADAMATRNTVFNVKSCNDAAAMGSNGGRASISRTLGRLQEGTSTLDGGRFKKNDLISLANTRDDDTDDPSGKPAWIEAIAER